MKIHLPNLQAARGFSLIEVMVAVVVICIGLLGIAKMQAMALSNTNMSRQRSLAAIQAASIASAMHSNRQYWASFTNDFSVTISGTPAVVAVVGDSSVPAVLQATITADLATNPINACVGTSGGGTACTAVQLAAFDVARWWANSVYPQLPNASAQVKCPATPLGNLAPTSCTVQIGWVEKSVAVNSQEAQQEATAPGGAASETPLFTLYVEP